MKIEITSEVITALHNLRAGVHVAEAVNTLDNAGVFRAIDEATGYDVAPEPGRVSKCTCGYLETVRRGLGGEHTRGCPGDPAEWGDMAFTDGPVQIGDNNVQSNTFSSRQRRIMPAYVERNSG